ncbi:unnamed protein product [marine sediment metagenome]|uniref:Uncharacterized protein n=1 Tax=marine sediment metagenome TaxID=412755 RepID=X0WI14_9ZZZZ
MQKRPATNGSLPETGNSLKKSGEQVKNLLVAIRDKVKNLAVLTIALGLGSGGTLAACSMNPKICKDPVSVLQGHVDQEENIDWYEHPEDLNKRNQEMIKFLHQNLGQIFPKGGVAPWTEYKSFINYRGVSIQVEFMIIGREDGSASMFIKAEGPDSAMQFKYTNTLELAAPDTSIEI